MNAPVLATRWRESRFTVAQIWALIEKGLLPASAKFELLDGEVLPMSPKGPLHEEARRAVSRWLSGLPAELDHLAETTLYLDEDSFVEPDFVVFARSVKMADFAPADVLLAIEVAHESWVYDTGEKAARYAAHGIREYWVVHAPTLAIRVHRDGAPSGWASIADMTAGQPVEALCAPGVPLALG